MQNSINGCGVFCMNSCGIQVLLRSLAVKRVNFHILSALFRREVSAYQLMSACVILPATSVSDEWMMGSAMWAWCESGS